MTRGRRIAITVGVLVAVQLAALGVYVAVQRARQATPATRFEAEPSSITEAAPAITARHADGSPVALTWPAPRMRILHFWATWCPPCTKELPSLLALGRAMRAQGVDVVAIAVDDDWQDITTFFAGAVPPEVIAETDAAAHKRLGVSTLPDSYLVDRDGRVIERYHGARDWQAPAARAHVLSRLR